MCLDHNRDQSRLVHQLNRPLDARDHEVRHNSARLPSPSGAVVIPDVVVIPAALVDARDGQSRSLETYDEPLSFVPEIWSPSTGGHDGSTKVVEYRARGHAEIWRVHPYERTVTAWRRQPNGSYRESLRTGDLLALWTLPDVTIDLDALLR